MSNKSILESQVLHFLYSNDSPSTSDISQLIPIVSQKSVQRVLQGLVQSEHVEQQGQNKGRRYSISHKGVLFRQLLSHELDDSRLDSLESITFNYNIWEMLSSVELFSPDQKLRMEDAVKHYKQKMSQVDDTLRQKEIERFTVEFSWKSSQIEGNTYTLLETEQLLLNNMASNSKTSMEAQMILNHKLVLDNVFEKPKYYDVLSVSGLIYLHADVVEGLGVKSGLRTGRVGVSGSLYRPLKSLDQIRTELENMVSVVSGKNVLEQVFIFSVCIPYLQAFTDGNKRTARLAANIRLIQNELPPLSYRAVSVDRYRTAALAFYEYNSLSMFSELFVEQLAWSAENYF